MVQPAIEKKTNEVTLGLAEAFINGIDVGWIEQAQINVEYDEVVYEQNVPLSAEAVLRIREKATIAIQHAQFSADRIAAALPGSSVATGGEILRLDEHVVLTGVVPSALDCAAENFELVSARLFNIDRSVEYVLDTDFTLDLVNATAVRIELGAIDDGEEVIADYIYIDTAAKTVNFGGKSCSLNVFSNLMLHHVRAQDCIPMDMTAYKVVAASPFTWTHTKEGLIIPEVTYNVFADRTKPRGSRLIKITEGSVALVEV